MHERAGRTSGASSGPSECERVAVHWTAPAGAATPVGRQPGTEQEAPVSSGGSRRWRAGAVAGHAGREAGRGRAAS